MKHVLTVLAQPEMDDGFLRPSFHDNLKPDGLAVSGC